MEELVELVNSVGFPIVACGFMFMQNGKMTNTINELTVTLKSIDMRIDMIEKGGDNK